MKPRSLSADGVMLRSLAIIGGIFIVLGVAGTFQRDRISTAHPSLMQSNGDLQQLYEVPLPCNDVQRGGLSCITGLISVHTELVRNPRTID